MCWRLGAEFVKTFVGRDRKSQVDLPHPLAPPITWHAPKIPWTAHLMCWRRRIIWRALWGRADGEVLALPRERLRDARHTRIGAVTGEFRAIDSALAQLQPGDLCLILVDQVDEALARIAARGGSGVRQVLTQSPDSSLPVDHHDCLRVVQPKQPKINAAS